jgi:hypothetical protein
MNVTVNAQKLCAYAPVTFRGKLQTSIARASTIQAPEERLLFWLL